VLPRSPPPRAERRHEALNVGREPMTAGNTLLRVEQITKRFPGVTSLDRVSFEVAEGEVHGLVGENGAGKSTLIKVLAGIYARDEGRILLDGKEVEITDPNVSSTLGLSFIHQELFQVPYFTIGENLFFGRKYPRNKLGLIDWSAVKRHAAQALSRFEVPKELESQLTSRTSMAYRYIGAIAKAVSQKCRIIFMDEPTASLTRDEAEALFEIIGKLRKQGISIVYISHRLEEIFRVCDRVTILREGKVVGVHQTSDIDIETVIRGMLGESLRDKYPKMSIEPGPEVLRVEDLESRIVPKISFRLRRGEILGLIGLVGSGRTELINLLFGLDRRTGGRLFIDGKEVNNKSAKRAIANGMGLVPEDRQKQGLILNFDVKANITLANFMHYCLGKLGIINGLKERATADRYVSRLRIKTRSITESVEHLSGGNQQKVVIAKWLDTGPKVLIFDEPTKGIDIGAKTEVYRLIQELAANGAGVILISSEIEEILGVADRFLVLYKGAMIGELIPDKTTPHQVAMAMQLGRHSNGERNVSRQTQV
jgi:ribose transport system ATP-binding protein